MENGPFLTATGGLYRGDLIKPTKDIRLNLKTLTQGFVFYKEYLSKEEGLEARCR